MERKTFELKMSDDGWMIASTPAVDRDKDRVMPKGAILGNYAKNPVLMFGHIYNEPWALIGKAAELQVDDGEIRFRPELRQPANDNDPMTIVRALWDQGLLKAASIGFNPTQYKDNSFGGRDFTEWELLEISLVPVPANQEALRLAVKGLSADVAERDPAATVAVNDTADESEPVQEIAPVAEVAEDATPTEADDLTAEDEAALEELLANIADVLASVILED